VTYTARPPIAGLGGLVNRPRNFNRPDNDKPLDLVRCWFRKVGSATRADVYLNAAPALNSQNDRRLLPVFEVKLDGLSPGKVTASSVRVRTTAQPRPAAPPRTFRRS